MSYTYRIKLKSLHPVFSQPRSSRRPLESAQQGSHPAPQLPAPSAPTVHGEVRQPSTLHSSRRTFLVSSGNWYAHKQILCPATSTKTRFGSCQTHASGFPAPEESGFSRLHARFCLSSSCFSALSSQSLVQRTAALLSTSSPSLYITYHTSPSMPANMSAKS